jgi:hypothetical protein
VKKNRIRLFVVNPSAVRWLGTAIDGQTISIADFFPPPIEESPAAGRCRPLAHVVDYRYRRQTIVE